MSDTDKEIREECDELLIKLDIPGYPDDLLEVEEFAKAQRRQGAVDALRAAADSLELAWATSPNSSKYPGPLNEWLRAEADRIEAGEDGE